MLFIKSFLLAFLFFVSGFYVLYARGEIDLSMAIH